MQPVPRASVITRLDATLALLSAGAGIMDALSYVRLSHVFTSAMTGNTALLGLALGQRDFTAALHSGVAFVGFILGLAIAAPLLGDESERGCWSLRVTVTLMVELALLAGFVALWLLSANPRSGVRLHAMIVLAAAGMGIQSAAVRQLRVPGISTTFFTGTLSSIVVATVRFISPWARSADRPANTLRQLLVLIVYVGGAAVAGLCLAQGIELIAVLPPTAVVIVLLLRIAAITRAP